MWPPNHYPEAEGCSARLPASLHGLFRCKTAESLAMSWTPRSQCVEIVSCLLAHRCKIAMHLCRHSCQWVWPFRPSLGPWFQQGREVKVCYPHHIRVTLPNRGCAVQISTPGGMALPAFYGPMLAPVTPLAVQSLADFSDRQPQGTASGATNEGLAYQCFDRVRSRLIEFNMTSSPTI